MNGKSRGTPLLGASVLLTAALAAACAHESASSSLAPPSEVSATAVPEEQIGEAIAFRLRFGLRADQAYVRAVASRPEAQAAIPEFGIPLMPAEVADLSSRRWDPDLLGAVRGYGELFPGDYAGAYANLDATGVTVAFKDDVERHTRALSNLVPTGSAVEVVDVDWSLQDLEGSVDAIEAEAAWFSSVGIQFKAGVNILENDIDLRLRGSKEAAGQIEEHFGDPPWLRVRWTGPLPWDGPRGDLTIKVTDFNGRPIPHVWCDFEPVDDSVESSGETIWGTDASGTCVLRNLPAVLYDVRLHPWVNNDHYDPVPIKEFRVELAAGGTTAEVTVSCQVLSDECVDPPG